MAEANLLHVLDITMDHPGMSPLSFFLQMSRFLHMLCGGISHLASPIIMQSKAILVWLLVCMVRQDGLPKLLL
jgi:hypothetical protein